MAEPRQIPPEELPEPVEEIEHFTIEMSDGIRLAGRRWQPVGAEQSPVPAVLEYLPYRKRDKTAGRDGLSHPYVAAHGYACVRVDLRGSGESEGVLIDEYLQTELDDGLEVLAWIADQPWCDGRVGMIGKSWGGFNGLQLAALRPPQLGAIITVCSTDDRYADDVHYMGGCLLSDNLSWAASMFANTSSPPDPLLVGKRWREMWIERLEGSGMWLETWLAHQRRDDYWKHGSVCEDFDAIEIPVLAVSGWADGYSNAVFRLLENLNGPRRGLIGPWSHRYPHLGMPGPPIGFLQECVRWWDRWLKGRVNGVDDEPALIAWMQQPIEPALVVPERPGRWVAEQTWPSPDIGHRTFLLGDAGLIAPESVDSPDGPPARLRTISSPLSVGLYAGKWCSFTATPDLPVDQREEDGGSLNFDSLVLAEPMEMLGAPVVELDLSVDRPVAMIAVRLSDRLPDDRTTRVTYGLLNLCHRDSHEDPELLVPGTRYRVTVQLNEVAHRFEAGHRLRLELSSSYWPLAWPSPQRVRLSIHPASSRLILPVRPPRQSDARLRRFGVAEGTGPPATTRLAERDYGWRVVRDLVTGESALETRKDEGAYRLDDIDLEVHSRTDESFSFRDEDPTSARGEVHSMRRFVRGDWDIKTLTHSVLTCTADTFRLRATLDAYEGETRVVAKSWDRTIPRDLM